MLAIVNAHLFPIAGPPIKSGALVVSDGKIIDIGTNLRVPVGVQVIDAAGRPVTPGLVEAHCHLGISETGIGFEGEDSNESGVPVAPGLRVIDGINVLDPAFADFRETGITCANILPGSANVIGGTGAAIKCSGKVVDEMVVKDPTCVKAALGEIPKAVFGQRGKAPSTRMGIAGVLREALYRAQEYLAKKPTKYDRNNEALIPVLKGQVPLAVHAHRADDIATAIRISSEFHLKLCLEHATEADLVLDLIGDHDAHLAFGPMMRYTSSVETQNQSFRAPIAAARAGIPFCFVTDHPNLNGRYLPTTAALAVGWGMEYDTALRAITLSAAEHAGISDRIGSLEIGKDADLVIWSDDPLEFTSYADLTMINGVVVYRREVV